VLESQGNIVEWFARLATAYLWMFVAHFVQELTKKKLDADMG